VTRIEQAILLAAGSGTRLLPRTEFVPKCLVEVDGRPLLEHLLDSLEAVGARELVVVTGYRAETLRAHLGDNHRGFRIRYVDSPDYATTNNIVSLARAAAAICPPFYLLESDVWAEPEVLARLAQPDTLAVAPYEETMDGTGVRLDGGGKVVVVELAAHKRNLSRANLWKTVNFTSISEATWRVFRPALINWLEAKKTDAYYEAVLAELVAARQVQLTAVDVSDLRWIEIDNLTDLKRAESLTLARK
jgi:NDP-sugar pyrophosphorylase family protein